MFKCFVHCINKLCYCLNSSFFVYSKCSLFIWRSDCLKQAIVERFCTLVNNYEWLFKRINRLLNVLCRLVKWTADCFVFVNNGEKLCHFVKIQLQVGVLTHYSSLLNTQKWTPLRCNISIVSFFHALSFSRIAPSLRRQLILLLSKQSHHFWIIISTDVGKP